MFYKLGSAGRALKKLGAIDFATTIAPGAPGRPADRQGVRGGAPQGQAAARYAYDSVVMDAPPTGPHHPLPQRQRRGRRAREDRPDTQSGAGRDAGAEVPGDRGAPGDAAGGDAGPGDRRTASPSCARPGCRWARVIVNMVRPARCWTRPRCEPRPGAAGRDRRSPRRCPGRASAARGAAGSPSGWWTRCSSRPRSTPSGSRWSASSGPSWRSSACRVTNWPAAGDGMDLGRAYRAWRDGTAEARSRDDADATGTSAGGRR